MKLDSDGAAHGITDKIATPLKMGLTAAAQAILDISVATMSLAVREVSVKKGFDPRDFVLVAAGGAGPLHIAAVARELHVPKVIVPLFPSHFSALGMLLADERHDFIRTFYGDMTGIDFAALVQTHGEMVREATSGLRHKDSAEQQIHLDLRYVGQEFTLQVPVTLEHLKAADRQGIRRAFDALYEHRYAHHSPDEPVEMVNIRLAVIGKRPRLQFPSLTASGSAKPVRERQVYLSDPAKPVACPVYDRPSLGAGARIAGPALIQEHGTTTVLFEHDTCEVAPSGELVITIGDAA
jgi:N-methylhydantoinase A